MSKVEKLLLVSFIANIVFVPHASDAVLMLASFIVATLCAYAFITHNGRDR